MKQYVFLTFFFALFHVVFCTGGIVSKIQDGIQEYLDHTGASEVDVAKVKSALNELSVPFKLSTSQLSQSSISGNFLRNLQTSGVTTNPNTSPTYWVTFQYYSPRDTDCTNPLIYVVYTTGECLLNYNSTIGSVPVAIPGSFIDSIVVSGPTVKISTQKYTDNACTKPVPGNPTVDIVSDSVPFGKCVSLGYYFVKINTPSTTAPNAKKDFANSLATQGFSTMSSCSADNPITFQQGYYFDVCVPLLFLSMKITMKSDSIIYNTYADSSCGNVYSTKTLTAQGACSIDSDYTNVATKSSSLLLTSKVTSNDHLYSKDAIYPPLSSSNVDIVLILSTTLPITFCCCCVLAAVLYYQYKRKKAAILQPHVTAQEQQMYNPYPTPPLSTSGLP